jgi:hypothetical protein
MPGWTQNNCVDCHKSDNFYTRNPKLHRYYQDWIQSQHHLSGVTCDDCHGGVPAAATAELAHSGIFPVSDERSLLHFKNQPETCGACHQDKQTEFKLSKHYQALEGDADLAPTCTTCHPAMNQRPSYRLIVLNSCNNCHEPGNRQNLPLIVDQAENLLRHLNMTKGLLGWTTLHYESHQWPGDSRVQVARLNRQYSDILSHVHRFDLEQSNESAMSLLDELRTLFDAAREAPPERQTGAANPATNQ